MRMVLAQADLSHKRRDAFITNLPFPNAANYTITLCPFGNLLLQARTAPCGQLIV
jgi:hypothetical protein